MATKVSDTIRRFVRNYIRTRLERGEKIDYDQLLYAVEQIFYRHYRRSMPERSKRIIRNYAHKAAADIRRCINKRIQKIHAFAEELGISYALAHFLVSEGYLNSRKLHRAKRLVEAFRNEFSHATSRLPEQGKDEH